MNKNGEFEIRPSGIRDYDHYISTVLIPEMVGKQTFYLRIHSESPIILPFEICTESYFLEKSKIQMLWFGIYF